MSQLVNAEVSSGNRIKVVLASNCATRIHGHHLFNLNQKNCLEPLEWLPKSQ